MFTPLVRIFLVSWLVLFCEIMVVRWLGMEVRVLKAFPNLIVIIALVATSAGLLAPAKAGASKTEFGQALVSFFILLASVLFSQPLHFADSSIKADHPAPEVALAGVLLLALSFCLYILFKLLGRLLGAEFGSLKAPLAYSANLLGSIAGALCFMAISWLCVPPSVWLLLVGAVCWFLYKKLYVVGIAVACAALTAFSYVGDSFSPYSKITLKPMEPELISTCGADSFLLYSNNLLFNSGIRIEKALNQGAFKDSSALKLAKLNQYLDMFILPVACAPVHDDVLILGSGPGNDVDYALKSGAKHVDAVEIDPVICRVGKERHPDRPLADPRTTVFNEDARTFLRYSKSKYDLIEFAYLDPGNTVDSASLVRVDNFVYTAESMKSVLNHLKPNGVGTLLFTCPGASSFIYQRIYKGVEAAGGTPPIAYTDKLGQSILIIFGPGAHSLPASIAANLEPYPPADVKVVESAITDDWPFLYLAVEPLGLLIYVLMLLVSVVVPVLLLVLGKDDVKISKPDWGVMFFLGLGFMLMETKSITQLSLLYGATWVVSSAVILFVLIFAFAANTLATAREFKSIGWVYSCLVVSLVVGYFWQIPAVGAEHPMFDALISTAIACLPVFFGSFIFSVCFKRATNNVVYLSANLIGVAIGGLTENICMFTGIKALGLVAMIVYGAAYVCWRIGLRSAAKDKGADATAKVSDLPSP